MPDLPTVCAAARLNPKDWKQAVEAQKMIRGFLAMAPTEELTKCNASSYSLAASP